MKFEKDGVTIEIDNPNTYSVFERIGFVKVEEAEPEKPKKK